MILNLQTINTLTMPSGKKKQHIDIKADLKSGDPARQHRALLSVLGLLADGREIGSHITLICQHILGNINAPISLKLTAYDAVRASTPTDTDFARISIAALSDLQKGSQTELRRKALELICQLPAHRLVLFLKNEDSKDRLEAALVNSQTLVRAAALEFFGAVIKVNAVTAEALGDKSLADLLFRIPEIAADGLSDEDVGIVIASVRVLESILLRHSGKLRSYGVPSGSRATISESRKASLFCDMLWNEAKEQLSLRLGIALSRFRTLPIGIQTEIPSFLTAYMRSTQLRQDLFSNHFHSDQDFSSVSMQFGNEIGFLLEYFVKVGDPVLVLSSSEAMFELAKLLENSSTVQALLPNTISSIMGILNATEHHQREVVNAAILDLLLRNLDTIPKILRASMFPQIPKLIYDIPNATQRVKAFYHLWRSVFSFDWGVAAMYITSNIHDNQNASLWRNQSQSQLQTMLTEPAIKAAIAGSPMDKGPYQDNRGMVSDDTNNDNRSAVFREELVGTLLYALLTHGRPVSAGTSSPASASATVAAASVLQAASDAVDWLELSRVALQGTKSCLGWDRAMNMDTTGTTAVPDLWLQLLLRCLQVRYVMSEKLAARFYADIAENTEKDKSLIDENEKPKRSDEADNKGELHTANKEQDLKEMSGKTALKMLLRRSNEIDVDLQGVLLQITSNWRALHPAVRPRAIWLCVCHMRLRSVIDSAWNSLADALRGLTVSVARASLGRGDFVSAIVEGRLIPSDSSLAERHSAAVMAGAAEAEEVALMSLERLAMILSENNHGDLSGELSSIAKLLDTLANLQKSDLFNSPVAISRLKRIETLLKPVVTSGKSARKEVGKNPEDKIDDSKSQPRVVVEISSHKLIGRPAMSYPTTLPSAASLSPTPESLRYRAFLEQLQMAALTGSSFDSVPLRSEGKCETSFSRISGGLVTSLQLADILEGTSSDNYNFNKRTEVAGNSSPISLILSHIIDLDAGIVRLLCNAKNRLHQVMSGVEVVILPGGPISGSKRPIVYKLGELEANGCTFWEVPLRLNGFGWPVIQATITLPVNVPTGFPSFRCRPYRIPPLELLAPPGRCLSPVEFYQRWQALPYKTCILATLAAKANPESGIQQLLTSIEGSGLTCVMKVFVSIGGGLHAAFHGVSWSGESIAVVVTSEQDSEDLAMLKKSENPSYGKLLRLFFGSESADVVAHIRGREAEVIARLSGGSALSASRDIYIDTFLRESKDEKISEDTPEERPLSTFSFLRSVVGRQLERTEEEYGDEANTASNEDRIAKLETEKLQAAAILQWKKMKSRYL